MGEIADGLNEVKNARSVLDVGCSLGYVLEAGRRLGLQSAGVDISEHAVKVCRERGFTAHVGTLDALPFADGCFDLVVMKHVLEHTPQPQVALSEVRRVLGPGGAVVIAVPNVDYWKGDKRRSDYRYYRPDDLGAQHYVYYSEDTLRTRLLRSGFEVVVFGKTRLRQALARRSVWWAAVEPMRAWAWRLGRAVGQNFKLQREVYVVARRGPDAG
ncbi:MAG: class I SAM-dependent methyltransferase [Myxococcaceae bacterium]|nr:class I SAM-dependent methyltransferase [Myxococcaceae bacterium]